MVSIQVFSIMHSWGWCGCLLVSITWIQLKIIKHWQWFWRQWCRDVASGADRHLDITFGLQLVESSSLVSVLFRETFNHPYISIFHLQVYGFSVIIIIIIIFIINFIIMDFSEYIEVNATSLMPLDTTLPEKCVFIISFSYTVWTKMRSLAGSLPNRVLADAILIFPRPQILPTNIWKVSGLRKKYGN